MQLSQLEKAFLTFPMSPVKSLRESAAWTLRASKPTTPSLRLLSIATSTVTAGILTCKLFTSSFLGVSINRSNKEDASSDECLFETRKRESLIG